MWFLHVILIFKITSLISNIQRSCYVITHIDALSITKSIIFYFYLWKWNDFLPEVRIICISEQELDFEIMLISLRMSTSVKFLLTYSIICTTETCLCKSCLCLPRMFASSILSSFPDVFIIDVLLRHSFNNCDKILRTVVLILPDSSARYHFIM